MIEVSACGAGSRNSHTVWYRSEPTTDFEAVLIQVAVVTIRSSRCLTVAAATLSNWYVMTTAVSSATSMIDGYMLKSGQTYFRGNHEVWADGSKGTGCAFFICIAFSLNAQGALAVTMADTVVEAPVAPPHWYVAGIVWSGVVDFVVFNASKAGAIAPHSCAAPRDDSPTAEHCVDQL